MKLNVVKPLVAACGTLALSACGGSDGMSSGLPPAPQGPAYVKMKDLTGQTTFLSVSTGMHGSGLSPLAVSTIGQGVIITYDSAARSYTVGVDGSSQTFGQADRKIIDDPQGELYQVADPFSPPNTNFRWLTIVTPNPGGVDLTYTRIGYWLRPEGLFTRQDMFAFGTPTRFEDMPRTGSANYRKTQVNGVAYTNTGGYNLDNSAGSFRANFASGSIDTQMVLKGTPTFDGGPDISLGTFNGTGQITAGRSGFNGTIGNAGWQGNFAGSFFGPQAAEFGYVAQMTGSDGIIVGSMTGAK